MSSPKSFAKFAGMIRNICRKPLSLVKTRLSKVEIVPPSQVDDLTVLAEALSVNIGLRNLESMGDMVTGAQAQHLGLGSMTSI